MRKSSYIHFATGLDVVIEEDDLGGFVASVPKLPGCVSQGEDELEARQNINDALRVVLDVMQTEEPERTAKILAGSAAANLTT